MAAAACMDFRQANNFDGAGAIGQPLDETTLLQRLDQAVDAGLGAEIQCILHLVEGRRNAGLLEPPVHENEQFVLLRVSIAFPVSSQPVAGPNWYKAKEQRTCSICVLQP